MWFPVTVQMDSTAYTLSSSIAGKTELTIEKKGNSAWWGRIKPIQAGIGLWGCGGGLKQLKTSKKMRGQGGSGNEWEDITCQPTHTRGMSISLKVRIEHLKGLGCETSAPLPLLGGFWTHELSQGVLPILVPGEKRTAKHQASVVMRNK